MTHQSNIRKSPPTTPCRIESLEDRRLMSAGDLDATFGVGGREKNPFGFNTQDVAVQTDGKILLAGSVNQDFALARLNVNGTPDLSFGGGDGIVTTDFGGQQSDAAQKVAVQKDGRIVVAGMKIKSGNDFVTGNWALARYTSAGALDGSFGVGGKATVLGENKSFGVAGLGFQSTGKIIFASSVHRPAGLLSAPHYDFITFRLKTGGALDDGFGDRASTGLWKGYTVTDLGGNDVTRAMSVAADDKIVVGGTRTAPRSGGVYQKMVLARYTATGNLDTTFDGDGKISSGMLNETALSALTVQPDGKVIAAGWMLSTTGDKINAIVRYNTNGSVDGGFGKNGGIYSRLSTNSRLDEVKSVFVRAGKIVVVGANESVLGGNRTARIFGAQYLSNGTLDSSFGSGGVRFFDLNLPLGVRADAPTAALAPDGKVVLTARAGGNPAESRVARFEQVKPTVQIGNWDATAAETFDVGDGGTIRIFRDAAYDFATRVYFQVGGTATFAGDYLANFVYSQPSAGLVMARSFSAIAPGQTQLTTGYMDIPAGQSSILATVWVINDTKVEASESIQLTLVGASAYQSGPQKSGTIAIGDNDGIVNAVLMLKTSVAPGLFSDVRVDGKRPL